MVRIKVCRLSEIINSVFVSAIYFLLVVMIFRIATKISNNINFEFSEKMINEILKFETKEYPKANIINMPQKIILSQLVNIENDSKVPNDIVPNILDSEAKTNTNNIVLSTERLSETKWKIGSVRIENYTKRDLDVDELAKAMQTNFITQKKVLIYHTHTSEGYCESKKYRNDSSLNNVIAVGKQLVDELKNRKIEAVQNTNVHDKDFNHAYAASLETVNSMMDKNDYNIVIDIHRDALAANSNFRPTVEINGETVAKLMFVIGTDTAGLEHDNWIENLKFAIAFQEKANEMYPGLFRDIHLSTSRYNQHVCDKAFIVEVGATGNTIDEAKGAMKYFAEILDSMS